MLLKIQKYFSHIKPVTVDGALYVLIALFAAMMATFSSDEAYKYLNPTLKYWLQNLAGWALATVSALKMFRSTSYSEHLVDKKDASVISSSAVVETSGDTVKKSETLETKKE